MYRREGESHDAEIRPSRTNGNMAPRRDAMATTATISATRSIPSARCLVERVLAESWLLSLHLDARPPSPPGGAGGDVVALPGPASWTAPHGARAPGARRPVGSWHCRDLRSVSASLRAEETSSLRPRPVDPRNEFSQTS